MRYMYIPKSVLVQIYQVVQYQNFNLITNPDYLTMCAHNTRGIAKFTAALKIP